MNLATCFKVKQYTEYLMSHVLLVIWVLNTKITASRFIRINLLKYLISSLLMVQGIWNALKQLIQNNRLRILLIGHISAGSRLNKVAFAKTPCNILTIGPRVLNFFEFFCAV